MKDRYLTRPMLEDLKDRRMVFIGGPRQVGKTTLTRALLANHFSHVAYYNWDNQGDRKTLLRSEWPGDADLLILDELHKFHKWKNYIKGEYDKHKDRFSIVLTGSSRLDVFRKGGDSLQGRYHYYRLHPFTLAELNRHTAACLPFAEPVMVPASPGATLNTLERFGGFPEPFIKQSERFTRRWHNEKLDRLFREDIRDTTIIHDLSSMRLLSGMLPERVGSLLSTNALREDLNVSFRTVARWLDVLETFYYHFRVYPFVSKSVRSLKKEPKLYLWDWSEVRDEGSRFENMLA
ncbi:MAG: AAA family ATPase, partial [Fibrobacterota bacterium]